MTSDKFSVRAVIVILGAVVLAGTYTMCRLALDGQEIPALLSTFVVGSLALLVPSPLTKAKTEPVQGKLDLNLNGRGYMMDGPADPHPDAPAESSL